MNLKVEEEQRINVGDIIRDKPSVWLRYALSKEPTKLPLRELKPVPVAKFQSELVALKQAQFNLDMIVQQINSFDQKFYHKDPWYVQVFES